MIEVYTDGGCVPNPGKGGWGVVIVNGGVVKELFGGEYYTTNNRMELYAAIAALSYFKNKTSLTLYTDSQYVKNGITSWIQGWKAKGWKRGKNEVKNIDLWMKLDELNSFHSVRWQWVKGHSGNAHNERADQLASIQIHHCDFDV